MSANENNNVCYEYEYFVNHRRGSNLHKAYNSAPSVIDAKQIRRTQKEFHKVFCSSCQNTKCKQWEIANHKDASCNQGISQQNASFFDIPTSINATTIEGDVKVNFKNSYWEKFVNEELFLHCQAMILPLSKNSQLAILYIDGRNNPEYANIKFRSGDVYINALGKQINVGHFSPTRIRGYDVVTDTFYIDDTIENAQNIVKNIFNDIANNKIEVR